MTPADAIDLDSLPAEAHERFMRLAIEQGRRNAAFPFGAVIVRASDQQLMAEGFNDTVRNPTLHGEIAAIDDYVRRHGSQGWRQMVLYTTGEPCPMCMSALIWSGIGAIVYATSIAELTRLGMDQIGIDSRTVAMASPFWHGGLLGGVLAAETDAIFAGRRRS